MLCVTPSPSLLGGHPFMVRPEQHIGAPRDTCSAVASGCWGVLGVLGHREAPGDPSSGAHDQDPGSQAPHVLAVYWVLSLGLGIQSVYCHSGRYAASLCRRPPTPPTVACYRTRSAGYEGEAVATGAGHETCAIVRSRERIGRAATVQDGIQDEARHGKGRVRRVNRQ